MDTDSFFKMKNSFMKENSKIISLKAGVSLRIIQDSSDKAIMMDLAFSDHFKIKISKSSPFTMKDFSRRENLAVMVSKLKTQSSPLNW